MAAPYIVGDSSPFLKRVLIPFWVVRIIILLVLIGLYAFDIVGLSAYKNDLQQLADEYHTSLNFNAVLAVTCVILAILVLCLILDIVCIVKRARRTLSPGFFLGTNIVQTLFFIINFGLTVIGARNGVLTIIIAVIILLSFLGLLIYASVIYHQYRRGTLRGAYARANDPEGHNLVSNAAGGYAHTTQQPITAQQPYSHDYPKTAEASVSYYDAHAAAQTQTAYAGGGYAGSMAMPQAYAPQGQGVHEHGY